MKKNRPKGICYQKQSVNIKIAEIISTIEKKEKLNNGGTFINFSKFADEIGICQKTMRNYVELISEHYGIQKTLHGTILNPKKSVLLIEPDYKNKFPPMGLMKLSTYYKAKGYRVIFYKGNLKKCKFDSLFDEICITSLFTFHFEKTVETINQVKRLCKPEGKIHVGGIMASLMPNELHKATGIMPHIGRLDRPGALHQDDMQIIDTLPLDYSILEQTQYNYTGKDSYFAYATRGCINRCSFCAVPTLEPTFEPFISLEPHFEEMKKHKDLILLDNNVLASPDFEKIIDEIKTCGFHRHNKKNKKVDFNQGLDARLLTDDKAKKLAEINIKPVRIAFDSWQYRDIYEQAIRTTAKQGLRDFSNYILFNHTDTAEELFLRLQMNINLCEELNISIYSFPMKYHPLDKNDREYTGQHWNRQFIRAIQCILNRCKGVVGVGKSFFEFAFGKDITEFQRILYMPENFIIYREENAKLTDEWWKLFKECQPETRQLIEQNDFDNWKTDLELLKFYQ